MALSQREIVEYTTSLVELDEAMSRRKEELSAVPGAQAAWEAVRAELSQALLATPVSLAKAAGRSKARRCARKLRWLFLLYWPRSVKAWIGQPVFYVTLAFAAILVPTGAYSLLTGRPQLEGFSLSAIALITAYYIFLTFFCHLVVRRFVGGFTSKKKPSRVSQAILWYSPPSFVSGVAQLVFYQCIFAVAGSFVLAGYGSTPSHPKLFAALAIPQLALLLPASYLLAKAEWHPKGKSYRPLEQLRPILLLQDRVRPTLWMSSAALYAQAVIFSASLAGVLLDILPASIVYRAAFAVGLTYIWALDEMRVPNSETSDPRPVGTAAGEIASSSSPVQTKDGENSEAEPPVKRYAHWTFARAASRRSRLKSEVTLLLLGATIASVSSLAVMHLQNRFQQQQFLYARRLDLVARLLAVNEKASVMLAKLNNLEGEIGTYSSGPQSVERTERLDQQAQGLYQDFSQFKADLNTQVTMFNALFNARVPIIEYKDESPSSRHARPANAQLRTLYDNVDSAKVQLLRDMQSIQQTCLRLAIGLGR